MALGSATVSPLEMAGLYAGLANGGRFAPPHVRRDRPRPEPVQLIGPTAAWYVGDILAEAPLPEGFASLPVALRDRRIAYKTGTSAGFRDAWAAGYSANWTVVVWVGHADGTPRPGQLGRARRRCRSCSRRSAACPPRTIARQPAAGRRAARRLVAGAAAAHAHPGAGGRWPRARRASPIRRPMRGSSSARARPCRSPPRRQGRLRWLVDGRPLDGTSWMPDGPGTVRVAVVDEAGRSSAVTVRIVERP